MQCETGISNLKLQSAAARFANKVPAKVYLALEAAVQ
jgi:hypothetical protein